MKDAESEYQELPIEGDLVELKSFEQEKVVATRTRPAYAPLRTSLKARGSMSVRTPSMQPTMIHRYNDENVAVVPLRSLKTFLVKDIERARSWGQTPVFVFWLLCITLLMLCSGIANPSSYNVLYQLESSHHKELETDLFHTVDTAPLFWSWLKQISKHLYLRDVAPNNYPLGYILLRQFRVKNSTYSIPATISPSYYQKLPKSILSDWDNDRVSSAPFGPNDIWITNEQKQKNGGRTLNVLTVDTKYHSYDDPEKAFSVPLSFRWEYSRVVDEIDFLEKNNWIDEASRLVVVDIMTYNPAVGSFALNHMYIEFFASGSSLPITKAYPFQLLTLDSSMSKFLVALDAGVLLGAVLTCKHTLSSMWMNRKLGSQWLFVWDLFEGVMLFCLVVAYYFRIQLWLDGGELDDGDDQKSDETMYLDLTEYGYKFERASTFLAIVATMAWLRVLRIIQHNERLGVLSQTIRFASGELISLFFIYMSVLIAYSVGATALFGADFRQMSSIHASFGYLSRLTVSAEVGSDWDQLSDIHPQLLGPFLGSFMLLGWLILLNMVLAIVSGSFAMVQATQGGKKVSWSFTQLYEDVKKAKRDLFGSAICKRSKNGEQYKRVAAVQIIRDKAHKSYDGYAKELTGDEWCELVTAIYTGHEAMSIYQRAEKEPRFLENEPLREDPGEDHDAELEELDLPKSETLTDSDPLSAKVDTLEFKMDQILALLQGPTDPNFFYKDSARRDRLKTKPKETRPHEFPPDVVSALDSSSPLMGGMTGGAALLSVKERKPSSPRGRRGTKNKQCWQCGEKVTQDHCGACGAGQRVGNVANGSFSNSLNTSWQGPPTSLGSDEREHPPRNQSPHAGLSRVRSAHSPENSPKRVNAGPGKRVNPLGMSPAGSPLESTDPLKEAPYEHFAL